MVQDFKEFINKGGVFEAAVGLILALAFAPVVQGLVDNILMPIVARIFGKPNFDEIRISLGGEFPILDADGVDTGVTGPAYIELGTWITTIIGFIIIAFAVFMMVKAYTKANPPVEEEDGPTEVDLLTEIRDSLAK